MCEDAKTMPEYQLTSKCLFFLILVHFVTRSGATFTHIAAATRYKRGESSYLPEVMRGAEHDGVDDFRQFAVYGSRSKTGENCSIAMLAQPNPPGTIMIPEITLKRMINDQWFENPLYPIKDGQICAMNAKADGKIKIVATPDCLVFRWSREEDQLVQLLQKTAAPSGEAKETPPGESLEIYEVSQGPSLLLIGIMGNAADLPKEISDAIRKAIHKMNFYTSPSALSESDKQKNSMEALIGQISKEIFDIHPSRMSSVKELKVLVMYTVNYFTFNKILGRGSSKIGNIIIVLVVIGLFALIVWPPSNAYEL